MGDIDAAGRLRTAAKELRTALAELNLAEAPCGCCGARRFENAAHAKVYEQFAETASKLEQAAWRLEKTSR